MYTLQRQALVLHKLGQTCGVVQVKRVTGMYILRV